MNEIILNYVSSARNFSYFVLNIYIFHMLTPLSEFNEQRKLNFLARTYLSNEIKLLCKWTIIVISIGFTHRAEPLVLPHLILGLRDIGYYSFALTSIFRPSFLLLYELLCRLCLWCSVRNFFFLFLIKIKDYIK